MGANIGWLFYKNYYDDINLEDVVYKTKTKNIIDKKLSDYNIPDISSFADGKPIKLITTYPGLLIGSGYQHDYSDENAFKIGFFFDYSTGLPAIPGSSIKGVLRSVFPFHNKNLGDEFRHSRIDYIADLLSEIGITINKSNQEQIIKNLEIEIFEGKFNNKDLPFNKRDIFLDAFPVKSHNHNGKFLSDDYITHHENPLKNPNPVKFLKILPEVEFDFLFRLNDSSVLPELKKGKKRELFKRILLDMGLGAKTNVGYGQFADTEQTQTHLKMSNTHISYEAIQKQREIDRKKKEEQDAKEREERERILKESEERRKLEEEQRKSRNENIEREIKENGLSNLLGNEIRRIEQLDKIVKEYYRNKSLDTEKEIIFKFVQQLVSKNPKNWKKMKDKFWKITSRIVGKETAESWFNKMINNKK